MALTKVTGQVINDTTGLVVGVTTVGGGLSATDGFFSGIVTAVGDASFSGNVSVGGTLTYEDVTNVSSVGNITVGSGITLSKDGDIFFTGIMTGNGSGLTGIANTSNIFADNINVGSGITLSSDGDVFAVGFTTLGSGSDGGVELFHAGTSRLSSASYGIAVNGDILFQDALTHIGDTDTKLRFPTADTISAETGGTERLRITSDGKVGIGTTVPQLPIHIEGGANSGIFFGNTGHGYKLRANVTAANDYGFLIEDEDGVDLYKVTSSTGTTNANTHIFSTAATSRLEISASGYVTGNGNVPCWYGKQDTHHTVPTGTWTVMKNLGNNAVNPSMNNGGWDESNGRFTAQEGQAGIYYCFGAGGVDDVQDADIIYMGIAKNGVSPPAYSFARALDQSSNLVLGGHMNSRIVELAVGDYVECQLYHNEGSTEYTEPQHVFFGGYRLFT